MIELKFNELKTAFEQSVYWRKLGLLHDDIEIGYSSIRLPISEDSLNINGTLHGGVMMTALDIGMSLAARSLGINKVSTIQLEVRFLQEVKAGEVLICSKVIHTTSNTAVIEGKIIDIDENLLAYSTSTFKLYID
ncbi:PaaI family thioesterase [Solibacillus sp. FSL W8-0474]|uniref:PaaI family thioesterase n=1 Tax=Solibacillus sp. FSL W8-0474 TaxID=2975336 RepID=UPI0030F950E8